MRTKANDILSLLLLPAMLAGCQNSAPPQTPQAPVTQTGAPAAAQRSRADVGRSPRKQGDKRARAARRAAHPRPLQAMSAPLVRTV